MSHGNGEAAQSYIQVTPKCFPCRGQCPPPNSDRDPTAHSPSHGGMDAATREATLGGGCLHKAVTGHPRCPLASTGFPHSSSSGLGAGPHTSAHGAGSGLHQDLPAPSSAACSRRRSKRSARGQGLAGCHHPAHPTGLRRFSWHLCYSEVDRVTFNRNTKLVMLIKKRAGFEKH